MATPLLPLRKRLSDAGAPLHPAAQGRREDLVEVTVDAAGDQAARLDGGAGQHDRFDHRRVGADGGVVADDRRPPQVSAAWWMCTLRPMANGPASWVSVAMVQPGSQNTPGASCSPGMRTRVPSLPGPTSGGQASPADPTATR